MSHSKETGLNLNELLTTKEVARLTKTSERHVQNLVSKGEFPKPIKLGRSVRFRLSDIRKVLNGDDDKPLSNQAI